MLYFDGRAKRFRERRRTYDAVLRTAQEYLRPTNRTILTIEPGAPAGQEEE